MIAQTSIERIARSFCQLSFDEMVQIASEIMSMHGGYSLENKYGWAELISAWANKKIEESQAQAIKPSGLVQEVTYL